MRPSSTAAANAPRAVGSDARVRHRSAPGSYSSMVSCTPHWPPEYPPTTQRRAPLPPGRARVVDLDQITALPEAADHVEAPAELRPGHLRATRRKRGSA